MTVKVYKMTGYLKKEIATLKIENLSSLNLAIIQYKRAWLCEVHYQLNPKGEGEILLCE